MEASPASPLNGCPCPHVSISNSSRSRGENDNVLYHVRRAKARFSSGCKSRPATFVPAGSNRSSCGGNETAEASGVEGHESDLVSMQAVTRVNAEQASKDVMWKPTRHDFGEG